VFPNKREELQFDDAVMVKVKIEIYQACPLSAVSDGIQAASYSF